MRLKSFVFLAFLASLPVVAACDALLEEDPDEDGTPTPTNTNTPTPVPSVAPTPVTTTVGDIITVDWGTIDLPAGQSPHFDFTAPVGTISIDFMAIGGPADQSKIFGFFAIDGPNGEVIDNTGGAPARQAYAEGAMSFSVPSDDSAITAATAGDWRFHVFAGNETSFLTSDPQILVKIRTAPSGVPIGEIDLNIFFVSGIGHSSAADCQGGSLLFNGLGYASGLYEAGGSGLSLVNVDCYDLAGTDAFGDIDSQDELGDLFALSAGAADERLNLFIVDDFVGTELGFAAGIAGSVPIPMQVNGTRRSGVAVAIGGQTTTSLGETIAHELGHSLGLYHTSEFNNGGDTDLLDPISDTPTCPELAGSDPGTCLDDTNVMFPQLTGTMMNFSAGQLTVLKPTVHVRRQGQPAFAPAQATITPIFRGDPRLSPWSGPAIECRDGAVRWGF